jgi:hypothetical protein
MLEIFKEAGIFSYERIRNTFLILVGTLISVYLALTQKTWSHFELFVTAFIIAPSGFAMFNKFVNSKYNTDPGQCGKPKS